MVSSQSDVKYREGCDPSDNYSNELHVSPDLAPLEPLLEGPPGRRRTRRGGPSGNRRSVGREVLRLFVYGLIIMTIGGAAFASQYGDDNIKEMLGILQRSVSGLSPVLGANPSARALEGFSKSSDQVSTQDKISAKEARFIQSMPVSVTAGSAPQKSTATRNHGERARHREGSRGAARGLTEENGTRHRGLGNWQREPQPKDVVALSVVGF